MIAMRTPGPRDADFAALEVLADVLSSRRFDLYGLVPQGKAIAAEFALDPLPQAGLAYAAAILHRRRRSAGARARGARDPRARGARGRAGGSGGGSEAAGAQRDAQFQRNSIPELASVWSDALALYGLSSPDEDLERIERVTVADVEPRGAQVPRSRARGRPA